VPALPEIDPVMRLLNFSVPDHVFVSPRRVEEAACIVPDPPKAIPVPFTVIEEFWRAELGRFNVDEAAVKGMPVAPVTTNPLFPIPHVVEVEKRVESCAVEVFQMRGRRAEIDVVPKVELPPPPVAERVPPVRVKLEPIFRVLRWSVPSPNRTPEGEDVPVPP
jgi:hypothetical protein